MTEPSLTTEEIQVSVAAGEVVMAMIIQCYFLEVTAVKGGKFWRRRNFMLNTFCCAFHGRDTFSEECLEHKRSIKKGQAL